MYSIKTKPEDDVITIYDTYLHVNNTKIREITVRNFSDELTSRRTKTKVDDILNIICRVLYSLNYKSEVLLNRDGVELKLLTVYPKGNTIYLSVNNRGRDIDVATLMLTQTGEVKVTILNKTLLINESVMSTFEGMIQLVATDRFQSIEEDRNDGTNIRGLVKRYATSQDDECQELNRRYTYLKGYMNEIRYRTKQDKQALDMLNNLYDAHKLLSSIINCTIYPKNLNVTLLSGVLKNQADFEIGMVSNNIIRLKQHDNPKKFMTNYAHEYGHFMYYTYLLNSNHNKHNAIVLKDMVKELRTMYTIMRIKENHTVMGKLNTFGKYLNEGTEIFARMIETLVSKKLNMDIKEYWDTFTDEELEVFKKHVVLLKL